MSCRDVCWRNHYYYYRYNSWGASAQFHWLLHLSSLKPSILQCRIEAFIKYMLLGMSKELSSCYYWKIIQVWSSSTSVWKPSSMSHDSLLSFIIPNTPLSNLFNLVSIHATTITPFSIHRSIFSILHAHHLTMLITMCIYMFIDFIDIILTNSKQKIKCWAIECTLSSRKSIRAQSQHTIQLFIYHQREPEIEHVLKILTRNIIVQYTTHFVVWRCALIFKE